MTRMWIGALVAAASVCGFAGNDESPAGGGVSDGGVDAAADGNAGGAGGTAGTGGAGGTAGQSGEGGTGGTGVGGAAGAGGTGGAGGAAGHAGAAGSGGGPTCALTDSGPVEATHDDQVIAGLRITSTDGPAIRIQGHTGVVVRNVAIVHSGGVGIEISDAPDTTIDHVSVMLADAPASGANPSAGLLNISCSSSSGLTVAHARLTRGSSGIYLLHCAGSYLQHIEGHDFRGPFPRGQLVQWNASDDGLLEDFSVENPPESWPEDNVNVYKSLNATIRRGLVDGNNSPSGVGVIFDGDTSTGLVEDVDAVRMGNGCFSNYAGADGNVFRRTRCRENICGDQGRGVPGSGWLMWAGKPGLSQLRIEDSTWFAACNPGNLVWPSSAFAVAELQESDFELRAPERVALCWE